MPTTPKQQSSQLLVRNKTKKGQDGPTSSRSSSLHSSTHRPPRLGSHRGEGSIVPAGSSLVCPVPANQGLVSGLSDDNMEDLPRVHVYVTQQNLYDQRSIYIQVGVDPDQVIQYIQSVESQAQSMVRYTVTRIHEIQHRIESVVHETRV